ncbi:DUF4145 domain-containing protein [Burkholderia cepacia]|uniref:DUF4145 domain-containing protein n=1 Tax=Burkholderia cepacia TaxID=292 RepID=UPI0021654504|nr:DUF4145 domain-containing protein [Burkholderia cepacia]
MTVAISPVSHVGDFRELAKSYGKNLRIYPQPAPLDIPGHLPADIAQLFGEASATVLVSATAAAQTFRHVLELALKTLSPEIEAWRLDRRIDALAAKHLITPAIQEWAHQIRHLGNEATHSELATREQAVQMERFTRYVLLYLYTLPKEIELARITDA